jgi:hypothetical protein
MTTASIALPELRLTRLETFWAGLVLPSFAGASFAQGEAGFTIAPSEVDYVDGLRRFMAKASDKACLGIRFAFLLAVTTPFWLGGRMKGFASLTPTERSELLDQMSRHRIFFVRELCLLLKLIACMAIFRTPGTRERTDYDGPQAVRRAAGMRRSLPVLSRSVPSESGDFPTHADSEPPMADARLASGGAR